MTDIVEVPLYMCREVSVYRIPPRPPTGHRSGDWKVSDKMSDCRLRVVGRGDDAVVYLDDGRTGELFAMCVVRHKQRTVTVEQATDSSRYFVLRIEDPATGRHAFVGMGFADRGEAFDFNVALTDQERRTEMKYNPHVQYSFDDGRVHDLLGDEAPGGHRYGDEAATSSAGPAASTADYSLKQDTKIHINLTKPFNKASEGKGGFLSQQGGKPLNLLPIPQIAPAAPRAPLIPPPPAPSVGAQQAAAGFLDDPFFTAPAPPPTQSSNANNGGGGWMSFE